MGRPISLFESTAVRLLCMVIQHGIPDDLGALLKNNDPELLKQVSILYDLYNNCTYNKTGLMKICENGEF